jgi:hypothetical protein
MALTLAAYEANTLTRWLSARLKIETRVTLFIQKIVNKNTLNAAQRVRRTVKTLGADGTATRITKTVVDPNSRSKPGEFPRADTTRLMKDIFHVHDPSVPVSRIGTTLKYGLLLEVKLNRSFLRRTLMEMRAQVLLILQGGNVSGVQ